MIRTAIAGMVVLGAGCSAGQAGPDSNSVAPSDRTDETRESGAPARPSYEGSGFALKYPPNARVDREGPGLTRFRLLGPGSRPHTEITDGFTVTTGWRMLKPDRTPRHSRTRSWSKRPELACRSPE